MAQRKCVERLKTGHFGPVMNGSKEYLRIAFVDGTVPPPTRPTSPFLTVRSSLFKKWIDRDGCGSKPVRVVLGVLAPSQTRRRRVSHPNEKGRNESKRFRKDERFDAPKRTGCTTPSRLPRRELEAPSNRCTAHECLCRDKQMDEGKWKRDLEGRCRVGVLGYEGTVLVTKAGG